MQSLTGIFDDIKTKSDSLSVTQAKSLEIQDFINAKLVEYKTNIERSYGNTGERSE